MTRRKRTPSPSPSSPPKRVAFEIPSSLQQFSNISRSLAVSRDSSGPAPSGQSITNSHPQPRPGSRSSSHSAVSLSTGPNIVENAASQFPSQKQFSTEGQAWHQPMPWNNIHVAASEQVDERGKRSTPAGGPPPFTASQTRPAAAPSSTSPQERRQNFPIGPPDTAKEPILKPGETPTLTTHPTLIASLIAKKRAENEAKGMRQRWARRQAEYRMSRSPASQLGTEMNTEAGPNEGQKPHPRALSNPKPAMHVPPPREAYAAMLSRLEIRTPTAEAVSTPATDPSTKSTETPKALPVGEDDSLFGSPFSSPMTEFLERATDDAGLKDGIEPSTGVPTRLSATQTSVPRNSDAARPGVSQTSETNKPPKVVTVPPLFSDHRHATPLTAQNQTYLGGLGANATMPQNQPASMHRQYQTNSSIHPQSSAPRQASFVSTLPAASHPPSMPHRHPYFQQTPSPSGYYKVDFRTSHAASSGLGPMHTSFTPLLYPKSPAQGDTEDPNPNYQMVILPMYSMAQQLQGQATEYGTAAGLAATPQQAKLQSSGPNSNTAADMVAGISTRFKTTTKDDFVMLRR
ncbi:hypothetical protein A1O3_07628 [Capronia epimyces CBS 606.96]|uniref:Uncharacterized protein n=1 Tax=Capronia epimyces CBS 606.96 TaxID=1182542 RepID=W9XMC3_9EURO|nr:uncharacterized protein A1O3_07628 [Capronia epimyces CBS 606.96]EXJ81338.1 hypothetical protein A1O3_07628 [Capronia epimyces CBS 606.96]